MKLRPLPFSQVLVLDAGAALHIPRGMWHRISSAAGTLAFSVRVADATAFAACK